jgi:hypothetical protein
MKAHVKAFSSLLLFALILFLYNFYPVYPRAISYAFGTCLTPKKAADFGSFACKNFRPDYTLDTSGTLPYVSGANLVLFADHVYDFHVKNIHSVRDGDVVYVKTDVIDDFFIQIYPKISATFVLLTHNSDYSTKVKHEHYLNDTKLLAWFGQNPGFEHRKHFSLPIGLENPTWAPTKIDFVRSVTETSLIPWEKRKYLLYVNFNSGTNPAARTQLLTRFRGIKDVFVSEKRVDYAAYMNQIGKSKYVLCPRGNGLDTHRFYETLLMGSIPVVENSTLYSLFDETSAFLVNSMSELTVDMLRNGHLNVKNMSVSRRVVLWKTWEDKINAARSRN